MRIFFTFYFLNMFCHLCFNPHVLCHFFYFFFIMVHFYISLTLNRKTHYFVITMTCILEMTLIIIFLQDTSITFYVQLYSVIKASTLMLLFFMNNYMFKLFWWILNYSFVHNMFSKTKTKLPNWCNCERVIMRTKKKSLQITQMALKT